LQLLYKETRRLKTKRPLPVPLSWIPRRFSASLYVLNFSKSGIDAGCIITRRRKKSACKNSVALRNETTKCQNSGGVKNRGKLLPAIAQKVRREKALELTSSAKNQRKTGRAESIRTSDPLVPYKGLGCSCTRIGPTGYIEIKRGKHFHFGLERYGGGHMNFTKDSGRLAGLLYVLGSIPGFFALLYVPGKLFVHGDATATANNIAAHETLFRLGVVADLIGQAMFIFVGLALSDLLKDINPRHALMMLTLILVAIPIAFLNEVNSIAALILVRGADYLSVFDKAQRDALARFFLNLRGGGFDVAGIFWGLWLFPLGMLVYRSRFLPRFLGVLLMIGTFAYLAMP
jgi:Domain of unknown function (DUF4386)